MGTDVLFLKPCSVPSANCS